MHNVKIKKGFALIEITISLVIIAILYYIVANTYFKKTKMDKETERALSEHGIDTSSSKAFIESTKNKVEEINKQQAGSQKLIEDLNK